MMIEAKIPIIGHNMAYDIMYFYSQFINDLPETYAEFRNQWASYFRTFDTKILTQYSHFIKKTWLGEAYNNWIEDDRLNGMIKCKYAENFEMYNTSVQEHEAAYDAYMTGVVFATLSKEKQVDNELYNILDDNAEYQECQDILKPQPEDMSAKVQKSVEEEKKERQDAWDKIRALKHEACLQTKEDCKDSPVIEEYLYDYQDKVAVEKNRFFYLGNRDDKFESSTELKFKPEKILWIKLLGLKCQVTKIFEAFQDLADIMVQKDDVNSYYVEIQTIYDRNSEVKDILDDVSKKLGSDWTVSTYQEAEIYQ